MYIIYDKKLKKIYFKYGKLISDPNSFLYFEGDVKFIESQLKSSTQYIFYYLNFEKQTKIIMYLQWFFIVFGLFDQFNFFHNLFNLIFTIIKGV